MRKLDHFIDTQLALDARSLALGRVALALTVLFDLAQRASNISAHYTDAGVMPRAMLDNPALGLGWSLHTLAGSSAFEAVLFAFAAVCALSWLVGWHTRLAQALLFLLTISLQARNPFLRDGQDDWLHVILFWTLWLPLGRRFSLDAFLAQQRGVPRAPALVSGWLALGLIAQLVLIYFSSAVGKCQSSWWLHGIGLQGALALDFYETHAGHWLRAMPALTHAINYGVMTFEFAGPCLLFVPGKYCRLAAVAIFSAFHLGMAAFLMLGIFPWLCVATWLLLLPSLVWPHEGEATTTTPTPTPAPRAAVVAMLPFFLVCLLTVVNGHLLQPLFGSQTNWLAVTLGLDQYWVVFSPHTPISTGYLVAAANRLGTPEEIDLFAHDGPLTWQRPALVSETFADRRWRQFYRNLLRRPEPQTPFDIFQNDVRRATVLWLCDDYFHRRGLRLAEVRLFYVARVLGTSEGEHRVLVAREICR